MESSVSGCGGMWVRGERVPVVGTLPVRGSFCVQGWVVVGQGHQDK